MTGGGGVERRDWGYSVLKEPRQLHEMAGFALRRISPRSLMLGHRPCPTSAPGRPHCPERATTEMRGGAMPRTSLGVNRPAVSSPWGAPPSAWESDPMHYDRWGFRGVEAQGASTPPSLASPCQQCTANQSGRPLPADTKARGSMLPTS